MRRCNDRIIRDRDEASGDTSAENDAPPGKLVQGAPEGMAAARGWNPRDVLMLQRSAGNRAVARLVAAGDRRVAGGVLARQTRVSGASVVEDPDDEHTSVIRVNGEIVLMIDLPPGTKIQLERRYQEGHVPSFSVLWIYIVLPPGGTAILEKDKYKQIMSAAADRWSIRVDHPVKADVEGHVPEFTWTEDVHSDPEPPPSPDWKPPAPEKVPVFKKPPAPTAAEPEPTISKNLQTVLEHMEEGRWDTDDLAANLTDTELTELSPEQRVALIEEIGSGYFVGDEDEETIDRLLETTPSSEHAAVIELMSDRKDLFQTLDSAIDGDEYRRYIMALTTLITTRQRETHTPQELLDAMTAAPGFGWSGSGLKLRQTSYKIEWLDDGKVRIWWKSLVHMSEGHIDLWPTDLIRVVFDYDEPEIGAKAGEIRPMPVVAFIALVNTKFRQDMWLAVQVAFVASGVGGMVGATGRLALLLATLDTTIAAASIGIDKYRSQIAATQGGRNFLAVWDTAQYVIAVYGIARIAMSIPKVIRNARAAFNGARGAILDHGAVTAANDVDRKLVELESALNDVEQEAKAHPPGEGPGVGAPRGTGAAQTGGSIPDPGGAAVPTPPKKIRLMHGTDQAGYQGVGGLGKGKIDVVHAPGAHQDLGRGFYMTTDQATAEAYGTMRNAQRSAGKGGGMTHVLAYDVSLEELGKVVDIRAGGNFHAEWEQFLSEPPFKWPPSGAPPAGMATRREFLRGLGAERRGLMFEEFLRSIGMSDADAIVGQLGDDVFTGITGGRRSTQVCIRSQAAADKLNAIAAGPPTASTAGDVESAVAKLGGLGPGLTVETGVALSPSEEAAAKWWVSLGKKVRALLPAADTGVAGIRTADLDVEGVGRVDVYTPEPSTGSNGVVRSILNKSGQAPTVHVEMPADSVVTDSEIGRFAARVFGHPTAGKGINRIVVRRGGRLVLDSTRRP